MKELLFVYNPVSGKGKIKNQLDGILSVFKDAGFDACVYRTSKRLDATEKIAKCAKNFELVVCAGGDGTLSETVNGMMHSEVKVPIGFIPVGSSNDTSTSYNIPKNVLKAAEVSVKGTPFLTDVGKFNDKYFAYVASPGSLAAVSCFTPQTLKNIFGHSAYVAEAIKQLLKMDSYDMEVSFDDVKINGRFFLGMITNALSVGGFEGITGGDVNLSDGLFEAAMLKKPSNIIDFGRQVDAMLINPKSKNNVAENMVIKFKSSHMEFSSDKKVQWVIDGEDAGKHNKATIDVCPGALEIMSSVKN